MRPCGPADESRGARAKNTWTLKHRAWVAGQRLDDARLEQIASGARWADPVQTLLCAAPDLIVHNRAPMREAVLLTTTVDVPHAGLP